MKLKLQVPNTGFFNFSKSIYKYNESSADNSGQ